MRKGRHTQRSGRQWQSPGDRAWGRRGRRGADQRAVRLGRQLLGLQLLVKGSGRRGIQILDPQGDCDGLGSVQLRGSPHRPGRRSSRCFFLADTALFSPLGWASRWSLPLTSGRLLSVGEARGHQQVCLGAQQ